jgi:hypothetical protein
MFYTHSGDDHVGLFNAKCQVPVLVNHMRKTLPAAEAATGNAIDLVAQAAEYKTVAPIGLGEKPEGTYGNTCLNLRGHYVLVGFTEDEEGVRDYKVLWQDKNGEAEKIQTALDARTADERKKAGGGKKGKK